MQAIESGKVIPFPKKFTETQNQKTNYVRVEHSYHGTTCDFNLVQESQLHVLQTFHQLISKFEPEREISISLSY